MALDHQGLFQLASTLGVLTNEHNKADVDTLLQLIKRQVLD